MLKTTNKEYVFNVIQYIKFEAIKKGYTSPNLKPLFKYKLEMQKYKLDTLGQVGKLEINPPRKTNIDSYKNRAKAKAISNEMALKLVDCNSPLKQGYFNTYYCSSTILQDGNKAKAHYCKYRWCLVCNRIRTANLIKGYLTPINQLPNLKFITLTVVSVTHRELKTTIEDMQDTFNKIVDVLRKTHKIKLQGIRKIECNYNLTANTYNPHFHCLLSLTEHEAKLLVKLWMDRHPTNDIKAQDIRTADVNTLPEMFKYFTKMLTKGKFYAEAQDKIFQAFKRKRTVQSYGIKKEVSEDIEDLIGQNIDFKDNQSEIWVWEKDIFDWVSSQGETWCNFIPSLTTTELINNIRKTKKLITL